MPQTLPLGRGRYAAYLKTDPLAPRQEPARTHEVKGRKRHGEGVAYRLFGHHALVIGTWTGQPMTQTEYEAYHRYSTEGGQEDANRYNGWGRLIRPDEIDTVAANIMQTKLRRGWIPPKYHWRRYYDWVVVRVFPTHLISYNTYGDVHVSIPDGIAYWWRVARARYHQARGQELESGRVEWKPFQVVEDADPYRYTPEDAKPNMLGQPDESA